MDKMDEIIKEQLKIDAIYEKLKSNWSINEISDMVEAMDEKTAKAVLKKYIYDR